MIRKELVLETIQKLPKEFTLEELIDRLILIQKVERGLKESADEKGGAHDEARKAVKKWSI